MEIVEIGFKLDKDIKYYIDMLIKHGAIDRYNCKTYDRYWTNKDLNNKSENEMKKSCIRLRETEGFGGVDYKSGSTKTYKFQNVDESLTFLTNQKDCILEEVNNNIALLEQKGYKNVFNTLKTDYQFSIGDMKSRIQLQEIENIGLLVYYDNPDYYNLPFLEQRNKLIDELNSYGFEFSYKTLGLDKLRSLYYKKEMYSENQNA